MSQFRLKNIDIGLVDEWIPRVNKSSSSVGDSIVASDPNQLAEAIVDTQEVLLKTSSLNAGQILKPNSGIAERLTITEMLIEGTNLQSVYLKGNRIQLASGKPFLLGPPAASSSDIIENYFSLDNAGNFAFKANTFKISPPGTADNFLTINNSSLVSNFGDLNLQTLTSGTSLNLVSALNISLKDNHLSVPITISQTGHPNLKTNNQSIVGAINELKTALGLFNLQSAYNQMPVNSKVYVTSAIGPIIFENSSLLSTDSVLRINGNQTVSGILYSGNLSVSSGSTTIDNTNGLLSSRKIESTLTIKSPVVQTPSVLSAGELLLTDKRISLNLSDDLDSALITTNKTLIGAINETKTDATNALECIENFNVEHEHSTGHHKTIEITTQSTEDDTQDRLSILNKNSEKVFNVTGEGILNAKNAFINSINFDTFHNDFLSYATSSSATAAELLAHKAANNPHNTVNSLFDIKGDIGILSSDDSVIISRVNSSINLKARNTATLNTAYDNMSSDKMLELASNGLTFNRSGSLVFGILSDGLKSAKNLEFNFSGALIKGSSDLTVRGTERLNLSSDSKEVYIQGVRFSDETDSSLPSGLGSTLIGALKLLSSDFRIQLENICNFIIPKGTPVYQDSNGQAWPVIIDLHPANEFIAGVDFFYQNQSKPFLASDNIQSKSFGYFTTKGRMTFDILNTSGVSFLKGTKLQIGKLGQGIIKISSIASLAVGNKIIFNETGINKALVATSSETPNRTLGEFQLFSSDSPEINADATRNDIIKTINSKDFSTNTDKELYLKAGIWGSAAKGKIYLKQNLIDGDTISLLPSLSTPASRVKFKAVTGTPDATNLEFKIGSSTEETLFNLQEIVNSSFSQTNRVYNKDIYGSVSAAPESYDLEFGYIPNTFKVYLNNVEVGTDPTLTKKITLTKNNITHISIYNSADRAYFIIPELPDLDYPFELKVFPNTSNIQQVKFQIGKIAEVTPEIPVNNYIMSIMPFIDTDGTLKTLVLFEGYGLFTMGQNGYGELTYNSYGNTKVTYAINESSNSLKFYSDLNTYQVIDVFGPSNRQTKIFTVQNSSGTSYQVTGGWELSGPINLDKAYCMAEGVTSIGNNILMPIDSSTDTQKHIYPIEIQFDSATGTWWLVDTLSYVQPYIFNDTNRRIHLLYSCSIDSIPGTYSTAADNKTVKIFYERDILQRGHLCKSNAFGSGTILLDWYMPGQSGNLVQLESDSSRVELTQFSGGTSEIKIYNQNVGSTTPISMGCYPASNSGFSVDDSVGISENSGFYFPQAYAKATLREKTFEKEITVGNILSTSGISVSIELE